MAAGIIANVGNAEAVRLCEAPGRPTEHNWITYSVHSATLLFDVDREFITSIIFLCKTRAEGNGNRCVHAIRQRTALCELYTLVRPLRRDCGYCSKLIFLPNILKKIAVCTEDRERGNSRTEKTT